MKISHSKITASVDTGMSYWYLFKHGLGPGTMPKGVNVLKVIDDGWKDYVLLDKMLTTDELNEYEIKEATPPDDLLAENGYSSLEETYQDVTSSDDMWPDTSSRYYVTPDISEFDIDFAAESVAKYLKRRELDQITTEDVIEQLRSLSDMWDGYWAYGLRTEEDSQAFLNDFLARLKDYGVDNVVDNTFASIKCGACSCDDEEKFDEIESAEQIEASWDNPNIFDFYGWYNNLTLKQRNQVDDWCDEWGYPLYDDCSREDLSAIHDHFESEFAQANETNFHIYSYGNDFNELYETFDTDDPKQAITKWVQLQAKFPMDVMITGYAKGEQILRDYVVAHPDWLRKLCEKYNCPYDPEYLIAESEKPSRMKPSEYTDQLHPFGLG